MYDRLALPAQAVNDEVSIGVTPQQHQLEEQQGRGPDARCGAKPGQDVLADHGLDLKQQEGAEKDRHREEPDPGARPDLVCAHDFTDVLVSISTPTSIRSR